MIDVSNLMVKSRPIMRHRRSGAQMTTSIMCKAYGHSDEAPVPTGQTKKVKGVLLQKYTVECSVCRREKVSWMPEK